MGADMRKKIRPNLKESANVSPVVKGCVHDVQQKVAYAEHQSTTSAEGVLRPYNQINDRDE